MATIRNYATPAQLSAINGLNLSVLTEALIGHAEQLIDSYCSTFGVGNFQPSLNTYTFETNEATYAGSILTLLNGNYSTDFFKFGVITVLEGANAGAELPVLSSTSNILTFDNTLVTGSYACKISQIGKFPMLKDVTRLTNKTYKIIPSEVVEALAWQCKYVSENQEMFSTPTVQSENIGSSYSYNLGSGASQSSIQSYIDPTAKQLLRPYTYSAI